MNSLKDFCSFVNTEYKKVLGHSKTRWLSLHPALNRLIEMFDGLKSYFLSIDKCPTVIKSFFESPISLLIATFLSLQSELFSSVIRGLEGYNVSVIEVKIQVDSLIEKLKGRKEGNLITSKEKLLLDELRENGLITENIYYKYKDDFYSTCIEYITEWSTPTLEKFNGISWLTLKNIESNFNWENILKSVELIKSILPEIINVIDESQLFDEIITLLKSNLNNVTIENKSLEKVWMNIFKVSCECSNIDLKNLKKIVEFLLCIPGTNASVERVFSQMNSL